MLDLIHSMWHYNYWAHHKLLVCVQTISEEDFNRPVAYSNGSVHVHLAHVMWAEAVWYARLNDETRPTFMPEDYPTLQLIREKWDSIEHKWLTYIKQLTTDDLARKIEVVPSTGNPYICSVSEILLHVVNHGTNHRSQVLQLSDSYGGQTFEHDISRYYRVRSSN